MQSHAPLGLSVAPSAIGLGGVPLPHPLSVSQTVLQQQPQQQPQQLQQVSVGTVRVGSSVSGVPATSSVPVAQAAAAAAAVEAQSLATQAAQAQHLAQQAADVRHQTLMALCPTLTQIPTLTQTPTLSPTLTLTLNPPLHLLHAAM